MPPSALAVIAVLVLLIIAVPAFGALVAARLRSDKRVEQHKHARYARTMLVLWTMTALALYALRLHGESASDAGLHPPARTIWYLAGIATVAALLSLSGGARNNPPAGYTQGLRAIVPTTVADWMWFVPLAATAATCEEFLYRGYALTQIAALSGSVITGMVVSSLAFGLGHAYQGRLGILGTAVTGLLYAALFVYSGSLFPCMTAHFVQDLTGASILAKRLKAHRAAVEDAPR